MQKHTVDRIEALADEGAEITNSNFYDKWFAKASAFIGALLGPDALAQFSGLTALSSSEKHAMRVGHLQGLAAKLGIEEKQPPPTNSSPSISSDRLSWVTSPEARKVFVVHGHDNEAKQGTARFLERLGLQPIILHEQASSGRTIIEKFETYSGDIAFAVILLTPDDVGAAAKEAANLNKRARQNVIMELGYFMGRLGRGRVCALHKGDVELPSDYQGVLYIGMDDAGAWRAKLAQEFVQAKLPIDLTGLLGG
ncbi:hypothetical protein FCL47_23950 [Desulfopila sp. IMCC35006]|uniref:TIR domain-containing protein n=1 Tax=Desulfopila sp. IMCC35006 TaxID=2569542 RepID=UPI0010AB58CC|nr:nucleotide-binding protein [Desulfopila sp. IMCC35006]TKB23092.1 hypothetical protein FCL47_23950 [Desulfopila sp. IMCC35006]